MCEADAQTSGPTDYRGPTAGLPPIQPSYDCTRKHLSLRPTRQMEGRSALVSGNGGERGTETAWDEPGGGGDEGSFMRGKRMGSAPTPPPRKK